jgi:hypothetical protein
VRRDGKTAALRRISRAPEQIRCCPVEKPVVKWDALGQYDHMPMSLSGGAENDEEHNLPLV